MEFHPIGSAAADEGGPGDLEFGGNPMEGPTLSAETNEAGDGFLVIHNVEPNACGSSRPVN